MTANNNADSISVVENNFDGTFTRTDYSLGQNTAPVSVAVGDLNFDGYPDIVVADNGTNNVSVLYNNGDGTFQDPVNFDVGTSPVWVGLADLRGYGVNDIVTANYDSNNLSVLLNNFDGTFGPAQNYNAGRFPDSLAIADVNGDGYYDLITTNFLDHTATVLLNNQDGTFGSPLTIQVGNVPSAVTAGDFNQDGYPDLAVANTNSDNLSVLMNDGNWPPENSPGASNPSSGLSPVADGFAGFGQVDAGLHQTAAVAPGAPVASVETIASHRAGVSAPEASAPKSTARDDGAAVNLPLPRMQPAAFDGGVLGLDGAPATALEIKL